MDARVRNPRQGRPLDTPLADERGILLEHLVACGLHRRAATFWPEAALFHCRTRRGAEAELVLEIGREAWGIEIRASRRVERRMLSGPARLSRRPRRIVVFPGAMRRLVDGVEAIPLEEFPAELPG